MNILEAINENPAGWCFLAAALLVVGTWIYAELTATEDDEH